MPPTATVTPAMRQYLDAKRQYRDAIVFFRMGDFYEMFYEDALVAARALELTLTSRSKDAGGNGIPMCGVPFHAADGYIARLVKKGFRVAICEQVEDPKKAKGLVRREVVRVVSPGTLTDASYLEAREPAFLMAIAASGSRESAFGAALIDLSTGEFSAAEYHGAAGLEALADEVAVLRPREIVVSNEQEKPSIVERIVALTRVEPAVTSAEAGASNPRRHGGHCSTSSRRTASKASASKGERRPSRPPAPSSPTCGTRRRSTSRTSARSRTGPAAIVSSSIPSP